MSEKRPTIVDIARLLGVSHSTVSRAFTHPQLLSPRTVELVRTTAADLGYIPNRSAQALSTGRPGVIGLLVPDITNPFFPPMIRAAQRVAERRGISVYIGESDNDPERELALISRFERQVEGFIIASSRLSETALRGATERVRSVLVNRDLAGVPRVLLPAGEELRRAIADFADHRAHGAAGLAAGGRVAYVGGPHRSWSQGERRAAVEEACREHGVPVTVSSCEVGTYRESHRIGEALEVAAGDLVIAFDDVIAHGLFDALTARGLRIPEQVMVLGCDGALPVETSPRLPTVRLAASGAGRRAAEMLLDAADPERVELPASLVRWPLS
ncbi:LacI family DNA-binding transcriptional regulator [Brachybacterium hainanense]|uniref:LacI family DNA-binding transcriptional regulator n=1 Tax=Brachybacterium hainanense TaxID=1541174 RepID=A0ABV6RC97_9MICO